MKLQSLCNIKSEMLYWRAILGSGSNDSGVVKSQNWPFLVL